LQAAAALLEILSLSADFRMRTKPSPQAFSPSQLSFKIWENPHSSLGT
jgi:hypothetical protein